MTEKDFINIVSKSVKDIIDAAISLGNESKPNIRVLDCIDIDSMWHNKLISTRSRNALKRARIDTLGELRYALYNGNVKNIKNFGKQCYEECVKALDDAEHFGIK